MREAVGNLWETDADAIVITTNGFVGRDGRLAMGRGCAREARDRFPRLSTILGTRVKEDGNVVHVFTPEGSHDSYLFTFPVKHNWWEAADPELIVRSANQLVAAVDDFLGQDAVVAMPRPGCGNGRLSWDDIKPLLDPILDDRFTAYTFEEDNA